MTKVDTIVKNKNFEIILHDSYKKPLPKNINGEQYFYHCTINPNEKDKLLLNGENVDLIKTALLKLLKKVRKQIHYKSKLQYYGEIAISFKNLKKKWIKSSVFKINSSYAKNIVYSTVNQIGRIKNFICILFSKFIWPI